MKNFISQLHGKEQNAIYVIKKMIAVQLNPLVIYCFGSKTISTLKRTAFVKNQFKEERRFTCDLLIITPDNAIIDEEKRSEIQEMLAHFGTVNMVIHPLYFVLRQMNEGNLFFNWVHKNGMLLYDRNNSAGLLPEPVGGEFRQQAEQFYNADPGINNYLEVKMQPIEKAAAGTGKSKNGQPPELHLIVEVKNDDRKL